MGKKKKKNREKFPIKQKITGMNTLINLATVEHLFRCIPWVFEIFGTLGSTVFIGIF